ncbi:rod shape-determining protein RodA [Nocardiopsis gilva YIM 90087]|uniref:peptidoglycan glycosyltransferase n=1 Tax=Nocardiopsis gilva YIM 90087 TaxID=1235441 RepID=A0A223S9Q4_9ACTN|nr:rod shape-determining protein RodA [Nocardiopsis gilva]ASU84822.1 rod shape-determining protein RodA [Nocardiopsis gilva YIM 90087]
MIPYSSPHLPHPSLSGRVGGLIAAGRPRRFDWVLLGAVLALSAIGVLLVGASTYDPRDPGGALGYVERQLLHVAVGAVLCLLVAAVDYRTPRAYAPIVYVVSLIGLVVVLTPLGETINGSQGWIVIFGIQAQPSEFAKIGLLLAIAMLLGEPRDGEYAPTTRDVVISLIALSVPLALIALQPDLGTDLVMGAIFLGMLTLSGAPLRWVVGLLFCGALAAFSMWWFELLKPYQLDRVATMIDPSADPQGAGYNANQAIIAIGSGGFNGTGLFQGQQTSGRFVPEQHTDFIFTVAAEELGFIGGIAVIGLLTLIIQRILRVAAGCSQPYARLVCVGVATWFVFQSFINIGMTLGVAPVTGLPLPFVSYGGTATVAHLIAIGLVVSIHARDRGFD